MGKGINSHLVGIFLQLQGEISGVSRAFVAGVDSIVTFDRRRDTRILDFFHSMDLIILFFFSLKWKGVKLERDMWLL